MNLSRLLWRTQPRTTSAETPSFYETIYPESVRYALRYNEAQLGPREIESLIEGFTYEALYLVIKAMTDPEDKRQYIEDLTRIFVRPDYELDELKRYLHAKVRTLPPDASAGGAKLAQLNRSGSDNWQDAFRGLAEGCYAENKAALPCLLAHTTMLGYHHFVQVYSRLVKSNILILVPNWMIDPESELMGYSVEINGTVSVTMQPKDECLIGAWSCMKHNCRLAHRFCGSAFFIDDTIHTSTTANKIASFWHSEYGLRIPDERIRVITDLRGQD